METSVSLSNEKIGVFQELRWYIWRSCQKTSCFVASCRFYQLLKTSVGQLAVPPTHYLLSWEMSNAKFFSNTSRSYLNTCTKNYVTSVWVFCLPICLNVKTGYFGLLFGANLVLLNMLNVFCELNIERSLSLRICWEVQSSFLVYCFNLNSWAFWNHGK